METKIYITIPDYESLVGILKEGREKGLFKEIVISKYPEFPIQIPIELNNVLDLIGNPIVKKMFGSKVDHVVSGCLQKVLEGS